MTTNEILKAIQNGEVDDGLAAIARMAQDRRKFTSRRVAAQAQVGDRVRLMNIRPKGLDGATGVVRDRRQTTLLVEVDKQFSFSAGRFARQIQVGTPLGVPASCIAEILGGTR